MKESIASGFPEPLRQNMEHQQIKKIFPADGSCFLLLCFGINIAEGDLAVLTSDNVFFLDNSLVKIFTKVDQCLIAVTDVFAVNNPLLGTIFRYAQVIVHHGLGLVRKNFPDIILFSGCP
jgi:hypothetical protein